jgi:hypothetical protein
VLKTSEDVDLAKERAKTMSTVNRSRFVDQPSDAPISEFALRLLVEFPNGDVYVIGTATFVAPFLAITARHVVDHITSTYGLERTSEDRLEITEYNVRVYQYLPGHVYTIYQVVKVWSCPDTDMSVLHLEIWGSTKPNFQPDWRTPALAFAAPAIGESIAAFGYRSSKVHTEPDDGGKYHLTLNDKPTTSTGIVEQILPSGQPYGNFNFPCYMVAAKFEGGMSGGPVFDRSGLLFGIISGSLSPGDEIEEPISYVCMLWPILRLLISVNRGPKYPRDVKYPIAHLVRDGFVHIGRRSFEGIDPALISAWMN